MVRHADARAAAAGQRYGSRMPRNEMIERAGTPNTGSAGGERTVEPVPLEQS